MLSQEKPGKKAVIFEIGDIRTDGRCRNIAASLVRWGMTVTFIGTGDHDDERDNLDTIRVELLSVIKLLGTKVMFLHYWLRAFWRGVNGNPSLIVAGDLYSLPAALAVKLFTNAPVLYDAKELYFALASLHERPLMQKFWSAIERYCITYADGVITSGERDSDLIGERYGIPRPVTINNHPPRRKQPGDKRILRNTFTIHDSYHIFLYQGWLMRGRGLFLLIDTAASIDTVFLVIMGDGAIRRELEEYAHEKGIGNRVLITGAIPYDTMLEYTSGADVGCALIEDYGMSYRHARPNKMFEYIRAHVPVLVSNMPAMEEVVKEWGVGLAVDPDDRAGIVEAAKSFIEDPGFHAKCVENCEKAATVFQWEEEENKLIALLDTMKKNI